ncbi:MAG: hypothetical protein NDI69_07520 [Bacteriovoracaceae bacterium]|nr:hypothetical protein [Bacteriovoracaceae bacterium]
MRTHILMIFMALTVSACASKRDVASVPETQQEEDRAQQAQMIDNRAQMIDSQASRIR